MINHNRKEHLRPWAAAYYRIEVEGHLDEGWSDRVTGVQISDRKRADRSTITCLSGRVMDQAKRAF